MGIVFLARVLFSFLISYVVLTYLLTHSLIPRSWVLLEKLTSLKLVKKFPAFYGTRRFITTFRIAHHLSLSRATSIQSIPPHPTSWRSIMMPLFRCLGRTKVSIQVRGKCSCFATKPDFTVRSCQHLAHPQAGGPPFVGCPRLLIQYIRSCPPYWSPFLHPQP